MSLCMINIGEEEDKQNCNNGQEIAKSWDWKLCRGSPSYGIRHAISHISMFFLITTMHCE